MIHLWMMKQRYLRQYRESAPGTVGWLIGAEIYYGGLQVGIRRSRVSPNDPRHFAEDLPRMTGGDRMYHQAYAEQYSEFMRPYVTSNEAITLIEVGILNGTGLAMWSELFPKGRIIGFDIDLAHTYCNMSRLQKLGAFKDRPPELYEFDQFLDNTERIGMYLGGSEVDIMIDDGCHYTDAILITMKSMVPYLARNFLYFIEDNRFVYEDLAARYPHFVVEQAGKLTIVSGCTDLI